MSPFLGLALATLLAGVACSRTADAGATTSAAAAWAELPPSQWPRIALINDIRYTDGHHPVAGCGFLLEFDGRTFAATAKHVLTYFKSSAMTAVDFAGTLERWRMYPKDHPESAITVGRLLNTDPEEPIAKVAPRRDWLLFEVAERPNGVEVLHLRTSPLERGEKVFVVGWTYAEKGRQRVHEGRFERSYSDGSFLIHVESLATNKIPGLSGAPILDAKGRVVGIMSRGNGAAVRPTSVEYATGVLAGTKR